MFFLIHFHGISTSITSHASDQYAKLKSKQKYYFLSVFNFKFSYTNTIVFCLSLICPQVSLKISFLCKLWIWIGLEIYEICSFHPVLLLFHQILHLSDFVLSDTNIIPGEQCSVVALHLMYSIWPRCNFPFYSCILLTKIQNSCILYNLT